MAITTPGIDFIVSTLIKLSLLPLFLSAFIRVLCQYYVYAIPRWASLSILVSSVPLPSFISILGTRLYHQYISARLGARLAPEVPGKWIGNFDVLKSLTDRWENDYPGQMLLEIQNTLGPVFNVRKGWDDMIFTLEPEHVKRVLATDFSNFVKGKNFRHIMFPALGHGVFNSDGDMWKFHRSMTRPFFTKDRISDFDIFDRHAHIAIERMKERLRSGYSVDFQDLMFRFTLDSAAAFLFGQSVHSLESGLPYPEDARISSHTKASAANSRVNSFSRGFLAAQDVIATRNRYGWTWPLWEMWGDKTKEPMRQVREYLGPIIREAVESNEKRLRAMTGNQAEVHEGTTLLDHLVRQTSDPTVIRDETMNIMIAGRDTTAATLSFTIYCLAMYPKVFTHLREEILEKVGPTKRPDYDDVKDMKYLRAVINGKPTVCRVSSKKIEVPKSEVLRLFPVVPFNTREAIDGTVFPSPDPSQPPIYIPAGTKVVYSVFLMHRRKDLWGPDAEEFDPERFLDERLKIYLLKNSFIFLPFNAGPRICLGQQFAYNEMSFMIIRLLQQFSSISLDVESCPLDARPKPEWKYGQGRRAIEQTWPKAHLTMYAAGGIWVKMQEDENSFT